MAQVTKPGDERNTARGLSRGEVFLLRVGPPGWVSHFFALVFAILLIRWGSEPALDRDATPLVLLLVLLLFVPAYSVRAALRIWATRVRRRHGEAARSIQPRRRRWHWLEAPLMLAVVLLDIFNVPTFARFMMSRPALMEHVANGEPFVENRTIGLYEFDRMTDEFGCRWYVCRWLNVEYANPPHHTVRRFHFVYSPNSEPPILTNLGDGPTPFRCRSSSLGGDWYLYTINCAYDYWRELEDQSTSE